MSRFVHLHTHSHYSLLEALPQIGDFVEHAKEAGQTALALTDNGSLYGAIEFYETCKKEGIKPILGMDAYLAPSGRLLKRARIDTKPNRLVLLAETLEGYQNLIQLSSLGFLEGFYYKPRIDKELLQGRTKGLIALSGGHFGEINEALKLEKREEAKRLIEEHVALFGRENFFLELVDRPEIAEQERVNEELIALGKEMDVQVVATKNAFYLRPGDVEAWKVLQCIKGGKTLEDFERLQQFDYDASLVSGAYMEERFAHVPEAIENTAKIAERCTVELELGKWNFPDFKIPEGKTFREVLTDRVWAELPSKVPEITEEMKTRVAYEMDVIDQKGFCPYFLIVSDYIEWSRQNGVVTTTRGSAAGSLVGFSIGISAVNPMVFKLPFERFLNPERPSAPDIDADFADNRRDEVLAYVTEKYGKEKVAQICTFGTMLARGGVRDVGRALGEPYGYVDQIAKLIPMGSQGFPMTLERALLETPELKRRYDTEASMRRIIDLAMQIEGCARHVSIHAAGVVISPRELTEFTPLQIDTKEGKTITQYEMKSVEAAGLIKMDFLGIRNLSILGDAVKLVQRIKGVTIDIERVPMDDPKTFELLAKGFTMGTFQLNGDGMTKYLMELRPERIEDIMAMVALYRPGPIESIPEYIRRKHDPSLVRFLDPRMKDILDKSFGVIVYQDDVMLIAIHLAGYSWLEADKLRKAMGKKIPEEMAKQKEKLLHGFVEHGMAPAKAQELWKLIEPFAAYGFNKAHAASYGMVAYETAFMKANYPAEYMTALMTAESADLEKIAEAVAECRRTGIAVLSPDINESDATFTYKTDVEIRFGLLAIKNLGAEVIDAMIAERKKNGPYTSLADFARRVEHRAFNKKSLEALVKTGALDRFGERKTLLENMERILLFNKNAQKEREQNQTSLFAFANDSGEEEIALKETPAATMRELLSWEKELLGLYVSAHPYASSAEALQGLVSPCASLPMLEDGAFSKSAGLITFVKPIMTKKGEEMAFVGLEDMGGKMEVIVFPRTYAEYKHVLLADAILLVAGKVSKREGEDPKLLANSFITIEDGKAGEIANMLRQGMWVPDQESRKEDTPQVAPKPARAVFGGGLAPKESPPAMLHRGSLSIALRGKPSSEMVEELREVLRAAPGQERVCFLIEAGGETRRIETDFYVTLTDGLVDHLAGVVGRQNVRVG